MSMTDLEKKLKEVVVAQEDAVKAVVDAFKRRECGFTSDEKPLVMLFMGSSGTGKTMTAKGIASHVHNDNPDGFVRLDMSEYQESHSVARLIGSPPGYVGYGEGGQLTEKLRKCPNAVVLMDEIEKAHPDMLTVLLPLFDEGRLTDGKGKTVECRKAIFIMTSNLGSDIIKKYVQDLRNQNKKVVITEEFKETQIVPVLKKHFKRDEFLGRISQIIYFLPFFEDELRTLVTRELEDVARRIGEKQKITLSWEPQVVDKIIKHFSVSMGARSIKNAVEQNVVDKLADGCVQKAYKSGDDVQITVDANDKIVLARVVPTLLHADNENHQSPKDLNILILGRTGVGKSTFINALANYVKTENMEDVKDVSFPIPASFVFCDLNDKLHHIRVGDDDPNEGMEDNKSRTRGCKTYLFKMDHFNLNIIDTPGIGDTEGVGKDKKNMEMVLDYLAQYSTLHAICILMKPDEVRLDAIFKYCILELLSKLEKSASKNILFIFTNARSTNYRLGASTLAIGTILDRIRENRPDVDIKFHKDTYYLVDSESFKFLVALRYGVPFDEDEIEMFKMSWKKSRKEILRMFNYIETLPPHHVQRTISVNEARRIILLLMQPLADIAKNINQNMLKCQRQEELINDCEDDLKKLKKVLFVPRKNLQLEYFKDPRTVCASSKCRKIIVVEGEQKIHYAQICHSPCTLTATTKNTLGDPELKGCACFYVSEGVYDENCQEADCGCSYLHHMHIYYDTKEIDEDIVDENTKNRMNNRKSAKMEAQRILNEIQERINQYEKEKHIINDSTSKFSCFLKNEAIAAYNDAFEEYLDHLIEIEKSLEMKNTKSKQLIEEMEKWKEEYLQLRNTLDRDINDLTVKSITAGDIIQLANKLCSLPLSGPNIRTALQKRTQMRQMELYRGNTVEIAVIDEGMFSKARRIAGQTYDYLRRRL